MTDGKKLFLAAVFSLVVGLVTAAVGYLYRDSFDAPRIRIDLIQYEVTRMQCPISDTNLYRFRTALALRQYVEESFPWSLAEDFKDDQIEYEHAEDLLRQLPLRKSYLEKEIPFVDQQTKTLDSYLKTPTPVGEALVKAAIAYVAGVDDSNKSNETLERLYAEFDRNPQGFTKQLVNSLNGRKRSLEQETELIPPLVKDLEQCYRAGKPATPKMVGNSLDNVPNVTFHLNVLNMGRTDGQISHSMIFTSNTNKSYQINLIGQNPKFKTTTSPTAWAPLKASQMDRLAYTIDRVRNEPEKVREFYEDLTSDRGISGVFSIRDIQGKTYKFEVAGLPPIN